MTHIEQYPLAAAVCGVLHNVFFNKPEAEFVSEIKQSGLLDSWPEFAENQNEAIAQIKASLEADDLAAIAKDYQALFFGPGPLLAYPWGSVYTDKEGLVFGQTTRDYMAFCQQQQLRFELPHNQPTDHFGLILAAMAELFSRAEQGNDEPVKTLLADHFLPWSNAVLDAIDDNAQTGYYKGFSQLLRQLLAYWQKALALTPRDVILYK